MTVEETIQALYADIAEIKEFICNPIETDYNYNVLSTFSVTSARTITIPDTAFLCIVNCTDNNRLSRIIDRETSIYDQFTFDGFGSITQGRITAGNVRSLSNFSQLDNRSFIYLLSTLSSFVHVNLAFFATANVVFYNRVKAV